MKEKKEKRDRSGGVRLYWLLAGLALLLVQLAFVLVAEFRRPDKAVAWLMIVLAFPFAGFVLYYLLARDYGRRQRKGTAEKGQPLADAGGQVPPGGVPVPESDRSSGGRLPGGRRPAGIVQPARLPAGLDERYPRLMAGLRRLPAAPIAAGNRTEVYSAGKPLYEAMLAEMEQAKDHIHAAFYIIRDDAIGRRFRDLWIKKAREGVEVRIMYDGVGSCRLSESFLAGLRESGAETHGFLPPLSALAARRLNYRNHRKMVIVDGRTAFVGGFNIGEEYVGGNPKLGFWRDTHLKIRGDAALVIQHLFLSDWAKASGKPVDPLPRYYPDGPPCGDDTVQVISGGPDRPGDGICETVFAAINAARSSLYLTTPYFIPDPGMMAALKAAAASGVDVRIILPGKPDSRLVHGASLSYMEEMMRAGVKGYLYQKGFIHAKVVIVDGRIATAGTANMDMRSFFSNFELNVMLFDGHAVARLAEDFREDLAHCEPLDLETLSARGRWQRMKEIGARLLSPLL